MQAKTFTIPFLPRSSKSDYACPDGEIAGISSATSCNSAIPMDPAVPIISSGPISPASPILRVEFALGRSVVDGWHIHPDMLPSAIVDAPDKKEPDESDWGNRAMETIQRLQQEAAEGNLFTAPFFALAAFRLKDGSHISPTPPVLMIPASEPPAVEGSADFSMPTMKMTVITSPCRLRWRPVETAIPTETEPHVTHLDIFVSSPVKLFDPKEGCRGNHRFESSAFCHYADDSGAAGEKRIHSGVIVQGWETRPLSDSAIALQIMQTDSYHLISRIPLGEIPSGKEYADVVMNCGPLPMLESLEKYKPDFLHLSDVRGAGSSVFSGRETLWDLTITPPLPRPVAETAPLSDNPSFIPRWIFQPDPDALSFTIMTQGNKGIHIPLRKHPSLHGSFFWGGFGATVRLPANNGIPYSPSAISLPGALWRSAKSPGESCGLLFPDSLLMHLDVGGIIAVCRAFRASGLVATTAPTVYCFTTEGVFLLRESDDGTFRDAGLICAYRLRDTASLWMLPDGVRFITDSGKTVEIWGTKATCPDSDDSSIANEENWRDFLPSSWKGEESGVGWLTMATRPLKLGDPAAWKRIRSVEIHGNLEGAGVEMAILGSCDMLTWRTVALTPRNRIGGLWAPRFRFFRIALRVKAAAPSPTASTFSPNFHFMTIRANDAP